MIHRVLPAGRWFEGGAPARRAGGGILAVGGLAIVLAGLAVAGGSKVPGGLGVLLLVIVLGAIIVLACLRHPPIAGFEPIVTEAFKKGSRRVNTRRIF